MAGNEPWNNHRLQPGWRRNDLKRQRRKRSDQRNKKAQPRCNTPTKNEHIQSCIPDLDTQMRKNSQRQRTYRKEVESTWHEAINWRLSEDKTTAPKVLRKTLHKHCLKHVGRSPTHEAQWPSGRLDKSKRGFLVGRKFSVWFLSVWVPHYPA